MALASTIVDGKKRCGYCKEWKPSECFYVNPRAATGLSSRCKTCYCAIRKLERAKYKDPERAKVYKARYHAKHPERVRTGYKAQRLRQYGVTLDWYHSKLAEQRGLCAICKNPETAIEKRSGKVKDLAVDHCHRTSRTRGLLCSRCNTALGLMQDSPVILRAGAKYLEEQTG